ncbi:MAG TPA: DUF1893 domain-containing protein [Planctomycetota bacterium]|nr:DUF1893 domain-containing protein [Planctomycetota bacterium]HRU51492.1 DUF1893 domain-containing protein [Planctomycetota bacterium]
MFDIEQAIESVRTGIYTCILFQENTMIAQKKGSGIRPLLEIYEEYSSQMQNGCMVDKITGRAAAFILKQGKIKKIYTCVLSQGAYHLLQESNIEIYYDVLTDNILNRLGTSICPLEEAVQNIPNNQPELALSAIYNKIATLQKKSV